MVQDHIIAKYCIIMSSYQFVVAVATADNVEVLGERPTIVFISSDGGVKYILCAITFIWSGRGSHHEYEAFMYWCDPVEIIKE